MHRAVAAARVSLAWAARGSTGVAAGRDGTSSPQRFGVDWLHVPAPELQRRGSAGAGGSARGAYQAALHPCLSYWLVRTARAHVNVLSKSSFTKARVADRSLHLVCAGAIIGLPKQCILPALQCLHEAQSCSGAPWAENVLTGPRSAPPFQWSDVKGEECAMVHLT